MNIFDLLASHALAFVFCATILGLLIGSFLNVVVHRLPIMMQRDWQAQAREVLELPEQESAGRFNLLMPDSRCPHCGHAIRAWENIPIISWLALRGRCAGCQPKPKCQAT